MSSPELSAVDPYDWASIAPRYAALQEMHLHTASDVAAWLQQWSDLERDMQEANAEAFRAKTEDTTDVAAAQRYDHLVGTIHPVAEHARYILKQKLLDAEHFEPEAAHIEMLRKLRAETALFRPANVALLAEEQTRIGTYFNVSGGITVPLDDQVLTVSQAETR